MAKSPYWIVVYNVIPELIASVEANSKRAVKRTADKVATTMRRLAPEDTGHLKGSIETVSVSRAKTAEVRVGAYYAGYVNYGTRYMAAQPFFDNAIKAHEAEFFAEVGKGAVKL